MANNIDLTISALECPLGTFQCSAWLILRRSPTGTSAPKRSCSSRFAASEPRTVLSFLCAFLVGLFSVSAPNQLFKPLRCSAWLIFRKSTLCFFFQNAHASGSLRSPSEPRTVLSFLCAFLQNARPSGSLRSPSVCAPNPAPSSRFFSISRRSGLRGCPLGVGGKGKGPAGPFPNLLSPGGRTQKLHNPRPGKPTRKVSGNPQVS